MNLSIVKGTETMVNAPVTPEQAHYILNYLGHTYIDPTTEKVEDKAKRTYSVDDINDVALVRDREVVMEMTSLKKSNLHWKANTDYEAPADLLASMIKCYREDTMCTQAEGLALALFVIDHFSEFDTIWDIEPIDAIEVIRDFLDYVRRELR